VLGAFVNAANSQAGKAIAADNGAILVALAGTL